MDAAIEEIEYLSRSNHRIGVIEELTNGSSDRRELRAVTGASTPTMSRILSDFEDRRWIVRDGPTYELTLLGEFVAERFLDLREAMEIERKLRDVWQWLPREMEGFSVDLFADAVVSYPGPGYPYQPVERLTDLVKGTDRMCGFDSIFQKTRNTETVCEAVIDGMELEFVYSPGALEGSFAWNPELIMEVAACENCTVFVHDDLPDGHRCGIGIADDHTAICCHDIEIGALTAVIDTDAPEAHEWAMATFERVRREARPVDAQMVETLVSSDLQS